MIRPVTVLFGVLCQSALGGGEHFSEVSIEPPYRAYLTANPLLMEVGGVKAIRLENGNWAVLAVASVVLEEATPRARQQAITVCRVKALAAFVADKEGVQIAHVEKVDERTVVTLEDGEEKGQSLTTILQTTTARVKGLARGLAPVGRWRSKDGQVFYLALGMICDNTGRPIHAEVQRPGSTSPEDPHVPIPPRAEPPRADQPGGTPSQ